MFFGLHYVTSHPLYQLQSALECFFRHCLAATAFDIECFPDWFKPVVRRSPRLKEYFETISQLIQNQSEETRAHVLKVFQNNNQIKSLCEDSTSSLEILDDRIEQLPEQIKRLFDYLYDETIHTEIFRNSVNGASIEDHYLKFRELNKSVCPFCGIENYPDIKSGTRASYDHYLNRARYPFAGINFKNLVPMCRSCNEPPNKGANDILFTSKERVTRRQVFFPYDTQRGAKLRVARVERPSLENSAGVWSVELQPITKKDLEKVTTWKSVFRLPSRLSARIEDKSIPWTRYFIASHFEGKSLSVTALRRAFKEEAKRLNDPYFLRNLSESALKQAFFQYLAKNANREEIESYNRMATTSYMDATANLGASLQS